METRCPICGMTSGKVSDHYYYCPECCVEFNPNTGKLYKLSANGQRIHTGNAPKRPRRSRSVANNAGKNYLLGLNYWRLKNGFTWNTLAKFTNHSAKRLMNWADCSRTPDSEEAVEGLCSVLGVTPEELRTEYPQEEIDEMQRAVTKRGRDVVRDKLTGRRYNQRRVICRETRVIYPTVRAAAAALNVSPPTVVRHCNNGYAIDGYHLEYYRG